ncbi:hypothetical protein ECZU23_34650 [Escherichia coli]|nr:hypothetical protein AWG99_13445 [Escherichia coli]BDS42295.1 hypothetical protein MY017_39340 [Escherichia coli]GHL15022.1 hypothetical protein ECZU23_34650 [Escherichia coli]GHL59775.1 hypothetical protein ECZU31_30500 [Escherichia coli]GMB05809.1 hypothetical protein GU27SCV_35260 [Escherichia coli]
MTENFIDEEPQLITNTQAKDMMPPEMDCKKLTGCCEGITQNAKLRHRLAGDEHIFLNTAAADADAA